MTPPIRSVTVACREIRRFPGATPSGSGWPSRCWEPLPCSACSAFACTTSRWDHVARNLNPWRRRPRMGTAVERFDEKAHQLFEEIGKTQVYEGELVRHRVYTRFLHWMVALFFFLALFSGFGIYLPWLFRWFTPIFGGGALSREMHPWFGLGFVIFFGLQALNWLAPMAWTPADSRWMKKIRK